MALEGDRRLSILMADCGDDLVPPGDDAGPGAAPRRLHRRHGGDARALPGLARRPRPAGPVPSLALLRARDDRARARGDDVPGPIAVAHQGWGLLPERAPRLHDLVMDVHRDPDSLSDALRATPLTFVAGDWKFGNVGHRPDGRTILLDWAYPGEAPPCWDLAWYLALNRARLPESKEATIARYRERLEAHGVATADWWDRQLGLSLVGMAAVIRVGEGGRRPGRAGLVGAGGPGRGGGCDALVEAVRRDGRGLGRGCDPRLRPDGPAPGRPGTVRLGGRPSARRRRWVGRGRGRAAGSAARVSSRPTASSTWLLRRAARP